MAGSFATTRWSVVLTAGQARSAEATHALAELCQGYWYPLYATLRRRGLHAADAEDLVQGFFTHLIEKQAIGVADPNRGRFRSFLLKALDHFVVHDWDKRQAQKRGGGRVLLSLDFQRGEDRYRHEPADNWSPEKLFDRLWALALLDRVMGRLRQEHVGKGKEHQFDKLKEHLVPHRGPVIQDGALRVALHRLRKRYRELLKEEIAHTLATAQETDDELKLLLAALRGE
jgi:RNA polymerase sigma-70 factor (ECF subfamily)